MSNELEKLSVLNTMIRPRSVYLTSESLSQDADATSAIYQLSEPVVAKDGFDLVYGVRAFGFNASATNISQKQRNNQLQVILEFKPPKYVPSENDSGYSFLLNSTTANYTTSHTIIIPGGLYTIDELFIVLSNSNNYNIFSGYKFDVRSDSEFITFEGQLIPNKIPFTLSFSIAAGGFTMKPNYDGNILSYYQSIESGGALGNYYLASDVNTRLVSVTISAPRDAPELYNLLFTNVNASSVHHPSIVPDFELNLSGVNPPTEIFFDIQNALSGVSGEPLPTQPEGASQINPMDTIDYITTTNPDSTLLYDLNSKYPDVGFTKINRGYRSYCLPNITPLYIEVQTDLETTNISSNGSRGGILVRQFLLGGGNGGTSFFQSYDTPIWMKMSSSREYLDSMKVIFQSEGKRWDFFNMNFFLELAFFEIAKQDLNVNEMQGPNSDGLRLPPNDEITMAMGSSSHNPFPFRRLSQDSGVAYFQNPRGSELKRPRF